MKKDLIIIKKRSIWSAIIVLGIAGLGYIIAMEYIIPSFEKIFTNNKETISIHMLAPIVSYIIIACFVCFTIRIFKELKLKEKNGLVWEFIWGLIWGLIIGLIWVGVFIAGVKAEIIVYATKWLIMGNIVGLMMGFYWGFMVGLMTEFN